MHMCSQRQAVGALWLSDAVGWGCLGGHHSWEGAGGHAQSATLRPSMFPPRSACSMGGCRRSRPSSLEQAGWGAEAAGPPHPPPPPASPSSSRGPCTQGAREGRGVGWHLGWATPTRDQVRAGISGVPCSLGRDVRFMPWAAARGPGGQSLTKARPHEPVMLARGTAIYYPPHKHTQPSPRCPHSTANGFLYPNLGPSLLESGAQAQVPLFPGMRLCPSEPDLVSALAQVAMAGGICCGCGTVFQCRCL